jgi:hypothetical protein
MFRTARYWIQFWASWNHSPSSHHISLIYTLILGYLPPITWSSKNIVSFCVSLIKFYTYFCLSMRATTSIVDLILLDSIAEFRNSHLGLLFPSRRRNYVLSKHWEPHIRHILASQETWTITYTSLPILQIGCTEAVDDLYNPDLILSRNEDSKETQL